jgi:hypothetical protein
MVYSGIDEAGLGPLLGPYCVGLTSFESGELHEKNLYAILQGIIGRVPGDPAPIVCDSKKLYTPQKGLGALENSVLSFFCLLHDQPVDFSGFLSPLIGRERMETLKEIPWFKEINQLALPLCPENNNIQESTMILNKNLNERGVILKDLALAFVPAGDFNNKLKRGINKGTLCQEVVTPLLVRALGREETFITIDRQGGRRYYGDWLINLLPGQPLRAEEEGPERSIYRSGDREIGFYVKGDCLALETALASLFAKYAREAAMVLFNRYWQSRAEIKKTAGYYTDGQRFIKDLLSRGLMPDDKDILVRAK